MHHFNTQLGNLIETQFDNFDLMFVHSDLLKASYFVEKSSDRAILLNRHLEYIDSIAGGCPVWFPAFNYDFPKTKEFDLVSSPSQVGPLTEYFRQNFADWRSFDPVFSIVGKGDDCLLKKPVREMSAFDSTSFLARLSERDAIILFYGADFSAATALHLAESMSGGPLYRYDKIFIGECHTADQTIPLTYTYHVRPLGKSLAYNWPKIISDLKQEGIFQSIQFRGIDLAGVSRMQLLVEYWLGRLKEDPLYFLSEESLLWVAPKLNKLGRRFVLEDYE